MSKRILAAFLALSALAAAVAYVARPRQDGTYTVTADVEQAPNLFPGGRVMVRGVEVGYIADVQPGPAGVRVTLEIERGVPVPARARLAIVPITVIADRYVQLFPAYRGGPKLADGDHIPSDRTAIPAELDDVLGQLDSLLGALEPRGRGTGPLARLVVALDEALAGRSRALAGTIEHSATVLENLADSGSDIAGTIRNLDTLFLGLANRSSEIALVNERFALVAEALAADQANLEGTVENLASLADETAALLRESGDDLGRSFARLARVLDAVLAHETELTRGIRWSNVIAQALGATDGSGRGRFAYTGRQASPGTPRSVYNYRIDTRDTIACERIEETSETLLAITPDAGVDEVLSLVLSFIPDTYDDDLSFLIRKLIPLCTRVKETGTVSPAVAAELAQIRAEVGDERFRQLLARYIAEGLQP